MNLDDLGEDIQVEEPRAQKRQAKAMTLDDLGDFETTEPVREAAANPVREINPLKGGGSLQERRRAFLENPDAYLSDYQPTDVPSTQELMKQNFKPSTGLTFTQNLTAPLSFGDEMMGAMEAIKKSPEALEIAKTKGIKEALKFVRDTYRTTQREADDAFAMSNQANPKSAIAGTVGQVAIGAGLGAFGAAGKGMTALDKATSASRLGALYGLGSTKADLLSGKGEEYGKALKDVSTSALTAGALAPVPGKYILGGGAGLYAAKDDLEKGNYLTAGTKVAGGLGAAYLAGKLSNNLVNYLKSRSSPEMIQTLEANTAAVPGADTSKREADLASRIFQNKPRPDSDEVVAAIKDVAPDMKKIPGYLLSKKGSMQEKLAGKLLKEPTLGGHYTRKELEPIYNGLEKFGRDVADKTSEQTRFQAGGDVKKGITDTFAAMIRPAEEKYDAIEKTFAETPLDYLALRRGLNRLKKQYRIDITGNSKNLINRIESEIMPQVNKETGEMVGGLQNIGELKNFRTQLGQYLSPTASPAEKNIVGSLYGIATRERDRSLLKYASRGKEVLGQVKAADSIYKNALESASGALGIEKSKTQPLASKIRSYLGETTNEKIISDLFNKNDFAQIQAMKKTFPQQYEQAKAVILDDIVRQASPNENLSVQRLSSLLSKYSPEVRGELLGELGPKAGSVSKTLGALPSNFNPSDTSTGMQLSNVFKPGWWVDNARSMATRGTLKAGAPSQSVVQAAKRSAGGQMASNIIYRISQKQGMQNFAKILSDAAKQGDREFAAKYYVLSQSYPEFRKALESEE